MIFIRKEKLSKCFAILILILILLHNITLAQKQQVKITGVAIDSLTSSPLECASVILIDNSTRNFYKGTTTSKSGEFCFQQIELGNYILVISYLGYEQKEINVIVDDNVKNLDFIKLKRKTFKLDNIEVVCKQPMQFDEDRNVTFNLEGLEGVENMSIADAVEMIPGVYFDFDGKLNYSGFGNYTELVGGKELGSTRTYLSAVGRQQYYQLKQIPAKFIKEVEIFPEPRGKYGYFVPIINIVPKGDLYNHYEINLESGGLKKYGAAVAVTNVFNKLTIKPELFYSHPYNRSKFNQRRKYLTKPDQSFYQNATSKKSNVTKGVSLKSYYTFDVTNELSLKASSSYLRNKNEYIRKITYDNTKIHEYVDDRLSFPRQHSFTLGYRHSFYVGIDQSLLFNTKAVLDFRTSKQNENQLNQLAKEADQKYSSSSKNNDFQSSLNLYYYNHKHSWRYGVRGILKIEYAKDMGNRKKFNYETSLWEVVDSYSQKVNSKRLLPHVQFDIKRIWYTGREKNRMSHYFSASVIEKLKRETTSNKLNNESEKSRISETGWLLTLRSMGYTYAHLNLRYAGNVSWVPTKWKIASPHYIDEYSMEIGNSQLRPEKSHKFSADFSWNPSGITMISSGKNVKKQPKIGCGLSYSYQKIFDKIVRTYSINDDHVVVYSYGNSKGYLKYDLHSNFRWNINPKVGIQMGTFYSCDRYKSNIRENLKREERWMANAILQVKMLKKIDLQVKYRYYSPTKVYQTKKSAYHDFNLNFSGMIKGLAFVSFEASNLFAYKRKEKIIVNDEYIDLKNSYPESPIFFIKAFV
ncbi:outer membrane beta-barrel protein [Labilibaculum euxinus]